ncbi:TLC domain-containing protein [Crepidotus variabilis]|uniref:TLC domain-containing protein n=1 Tax=Crepidotus variabilis TaxID=179855 RepID=A0A9P6EN79_9AGAR|nr:TLC domain-containing protein [Crepidotus variabilis]
MVLLERFVSEKLGLTKFPPFLPTFYAAFLGFTLIHLGLAPYFSARWFPVAFGAKGRGAKNNWSIHVVSQVHALIIVPYAAWCILHEASESSLQDRVFGWDSRAGHLFAIACGYFVWDTLDASINFIDAGFVAHGVACTLIYSMVFTPFVAYYGARCLLWETSTIFLNNHWFLDKLGRTGTRIQAINGICLLGAFFFVRLVYGGMISFHFMMDVLEMRRQAPLLHVMVYGIGNVVLVGLNWFWFFKMISALRKRFDGPGERTKLLNQAETASPGVPTTTTTTS